MRDLKADLEICNKATPGPWIQDRCNVSAQGYTLFITYVSGKNDAQFVAAAREGWPEAIERAIKAEDEVERLRLMVKSITGGLDEAIEAVHFLETENAKLQLALKKACDMLPACPDELGRLDDMFLRAAERDLRELEG